MVEYGYRYEDADVGIFRSRLKIEELTRTANERAVEDALILDQYRGRKSYKEFLKKYNSFEYPFLHEARVHLFRRDVYLERGQNAKDNKARREKYTVAYWENRILEKYFGPLLQASSYVWSPEVLSEVKANANTGLKYESLVSSRLITNFSQVQILWFLGSAMILFILLGRFFGARIKS